jgi:hypothetical protein
MNEQTEPTNKNEILELIQVERSRLEATIGKLTESQMLAPELEGERSVKDVLAHISAWEQLMVQWLVETYAGLTPERPAPGMTWDNLDQLNEQIYQKNQGRSLAEVLAMSKSAHSQAFQAVQEMTDRDLFDGARFAWRNGDPMWHMVAANTWWHYKEHSEQIEAWLNASH